MILAYLDPGAGSMVIQALLASILAIPFLFRGAVSRLVHRIRGRGSSLPLRGSSDRDGDS